ncbi:amidase signature enzyme [Amylocystis lapponica]|nr:amidase signature enzyme [Amylocystis lapponica]
MQALLWFASLAFVTAIASAAQISFTLTGQTLILGNVSYFVYPKPVSTFELGPLAGLIGYAGKAYAQELIPFSVVSTTSTKFTDRDLDTIIASYSVRDDVWNEAFLAGVFVKYDGSASAATLQLGSSQKKYGIDFVLASNKYLTGIATSISLPPGPYFLKASSGEVYEAYRLYDDPQQSFDYGVMPDLDSSGGYQILPAKIPGAATETIGVPSRLYFTPTPEKPLAGLRLAVKDIYDVKGLRTGCGNRAYYNLYPEKTTTGPALQRLLNAGMVLVGKAKTSQFANGETATDDWVDLHAPYNPRGDGYQDGSSSSTGPGTAMAAYDWLDHAIGSDTGGSMRGPSGANGVYGNRPSRGSLPTDDVMPLSPALDTLGIFARDAKTWATAGHWWYANLTSYSKFPKNIMFAVDTWGSSFLTTPPPAGTASATFNTFIGKLEAFLNTTRTEFNMTTLWASTMPSNVSVPLRTLLNTTYPTLISMDQTRLLATPFFADYSAQNGLRKPFIDPAPLARWAYGYAQPTGAYNEAIANKTAFMNWFAEQVVPADPDTCSESIFLYPQSSGGTNYRNNYIACAAQLGFSAGRIAVMAETPDMVVPIGEQPYNSTITGMVEYLPVTMSFVARKDCDLMLFDLFAALQDAGIIGPVKTGTRLF